MKDMSKQITQIVDEKVETLVNTSFALVSDVYFKDAVAKYLVRSFVWAMYDHYEKHEDLAEMFEQFPDLIRERDREDRAG